MRPVQILVFSLFFVASGVSAQDQVSEECVCPDEGKKEECKATISHRGQWLAVTSNASECSVVSWNDEDETEHVRWVREHINWDDSYSVTEESVFLDISCFVCPDQIME